MTSSIIPYLSVLNIWRRGAGVDSPATKNVLDLKVNKTSRYPSFDIDFVLIGIWAL